MIMVFGINAAAAGVYRIDEINAVINVPDSYEVYTRGADTFISDDKDAVLVAVSAQKQGASADEIVITVSEDSQSADVYNLNRFTKGKLADIANEMLAYIPKAQNYTLFENGQTVFVNATADDTESVPLVFSEFYTTIVNGKRITVTLNSYDSAIVDSDRQVLENIVLSMKFDKILTGGMTDYNTLVRNCIISAAVVLVILTVLAVVFGKRAEKPKKSEKAVVAKSEVAEPEPSITQYKPQITVHILDENFGYSQTNRSEAKEFADYIDAQNTLYLHTFTDENGIDRTEAMGYSAWMQLKREYDESHFVV